MNDRAVLQILNEIEDSGLLVKIHRAFTELEELISFYVQWSRAVRECTDFVDNMKQSDVPSLVEGVAEAKMMQSCDIRARTGFEDHRVDVSEVLTKKTEMDGQVIAKAAGFLDEDENMWRLMAECTMSLVRNKEFDYERLEDAGLDMLWVS